MLGVFSHLQQAVQDVKEYIFVTHEAATCEFRAYTISSCMGSYRPKYLDPMCLYYNRENNGAGRW